MDWKNMSVEERRIWALEKADFALKLAYGEPKASAFAIADALIEYVNGSASPESLSGDVPVAREIADTRDLQPLEAI